MDLKNYKYAFNDESTCVLINKECKVYDTNTNKFRDAKYLMGRGYLRISIHGEHYLAHRVVKLTFDPIANPELYDVHHKDEIKTHNSYNNLEYVLKGEHSSSHNTGSGNGRAKLTEEAAKYIKYDTIEHAYTKTKNLVFDKFDIIPTKDMVYKIRSGKTWKHI